MNDEHARRPANVSRPDRLDRGEWVLVGWFLAGPGIVVVSLLMAAARPVVGQLSVAVALMALVAAAATAGGRGCGLTGAVMAGMAFNFFHTQPYLSLRIRSSDDAVSTLLLLAAGVGFGELAVRREAVARRFSGSRDMLDELQQLTELVADGTPQAEVWEQSAASLTRRLSLADCRFEPFGTEAPSLPRITATRTVPATRFAHFRSRGFELPATGAELAVSHRGEMLGRIVLVPRAAEGVSVDSRRFAVAVAATFAGSVRRPGEPDGLGSHGIGPTDD